MEFQYIIFDMDGTLLDSIPYWKRLARNYMEDLKVTVPDDLDERLDGLGKDMDSLEKELRKALEEMQKNNEEMNRKLDEKLDKQMDALSSEALSYRYEEQTNTLYLMPGQNKSDK